MLGIRLDSGDLAYLSIKSRAMLDEAGFKDAAIVASNELDETIISELKTPRGLYRRLGCWNKSCHRWQPTGSDGVYKLSAIRDPGEAWKNISLNFPNR